MTETTSRLKKTWFFLLVPLLTLGAVLFFAQKAMPENSATAQYWIKSLFFLLVLALVPATSIYQTRLLKKHREKEDDARLAIFEKTYRIRLFTLSFLAAASLPLSHTTGDRAYWMIYGVLMILLMINFPSQGLVSKEMHKD